MKTTAILNYLLDCFLVIIPALIVNLLWASRLPPMWQFERFWTDIPASITEQTPQALLGCYERMTTVSNGRGFSISEQPGIQVYDSMSLNLL